MTKLKGRAQSKIDLSRVPVTSAQQHLIFCFKHLDPKYLKDGAIKGYKALFDKIRQLACLNWQQVDSGGLCLKSPKFERLLRQTIDF